MWRTLARRALLSNRSAASTLHFHSQVTHLETTATITEKASHLFINSPRFNSCNPRFYSANPSGHYEDSPIPEPKGDVDFSGVNESVDGNKLEDENENEDSISVDAGGDLFSLLQSDAVDESSLVSRLEGMDDLVLDEDLLLKVLETPSVSAGNLLVFFLWGLEKLEFRVGAQVMDALVRAVCMEKGARHIPDLWELVKKVGGKEEGVVTAKSLNRLLGKFVQTISQGKGPSGVIVNFEELAFEVFTKFEELGCQLNADSYYFTIEVLSKKSKYERACLVCEKMLDADMLPENANKVGAIIKYLCKGGRARDAHLVYIHVKDKKICLPRSFIDFLVTSLCPLERTFAESSEEISEEKESLALALEMLDDYSAEDRKAATKPYWSIIQKLCVFGDLARAHKLLHEMIESGPTPENAAFNCVINGLAKRGDIDEALKLMKLMENICSKPNLFAYSVVISAYVRKGSMEEASKLFDEAKEKHGKLHRVTYHSIIRGFCRIGQYDKAMSLLEEMKQQGVEPNHDDYNKFIKSLCMKAVDWKTAEKLRADMESRGVILNGRTSALIDSVKQLQGEEIAELPATA